jgi:hypothetical protein
LITGFRFDQEGYTTVIPDQGPPYIKRSGSGFTPLLFLYILPLRTFPPPFFLSILFALTRTGLSDSYPGADRKESRPHAQDTERRTHPGLPLWHEHRATGGRRGTINSGAKNDNLYIYVIKNSHSPVKLWFLCDFLSLKNDANVPSKSKKQKKLTEEKIIYSISQQRYGSADADSDPDLY